MVAAVPGSPVRVHVRASRGTSAPPTRRGRLRSRCRVSISATPAVAWGTNTCRSPSPPALAGERADARRQVGDEPAPRPDAQPPRCASGERLRERGLGEHLGVLVLGRTRRAGAPMRRGHRIRATARTAGRPPCRACRSRWRTPWRTTAPAGSVGERSASTSAPRATARSSARARSCGWRAPARATPRCPDGSWRPGTARKIGSRSGERYAVSTSPARSTRVRLWRERVRQPRERRSRLVDRRARLQQVAQHDGDAEPVAEYPPAAERERDREPVVVHAVEQPHRQSLIPMTRFSSSRVARSMPSIREGA